MTVALRFALQRNADAELGALLTVVPALAVALAFVVVDVARHGVPELGGLCPFRVPLAGLGAFVPAGLLFGLSYVCLFEAFYRGRVSVVSPIVATESLWGVGLSALLLRRHELVGVRLALGAVLIVAGGALIGVFR